VSTIEDELFAAMGERRGTDAANGLCEACVQLLSIDAAAISLVFDGANIGTLGVSAPTVRRYDEEQFTHGEGPCLDAVACRAPVTVADLADPAETRWPGYGPAMLDHRVRGVYAMPIAVAGEYVGALDVYQFQPATLSVEQVAGLAEAAEIAQMPILDLLDHKFDQAVAAPGSDAWNELAALTRAEVSKATGMLMAQLDIAAPVALVRLRAHAYATGRSATEVAREILHNGLRLESN
jgi:hypothetical protein